MNLQIIRAGCIGLATEAFGDPVPPNRRFSSWARWRPVAREAARGRGLDRLAISPLAPLYSSIPLGSSS
jgi:hypothetical protein